MSDADVAEPKAPEDPLIVTAVVEPPETNANESAHSILTVNTSTISMVPQRRKTVTVNNRPSNPSTESFALSAPRSQLSILTNMTHPLDEDVPSIDEPFCLHMIAESNSQIFEDNTFNFPPNKDPGIDDYMELYEVDI